MGTVKRTVRAMRHVAKSIASGIRNKWEDLLVAVEHFFKKAAAKIMDLLAVMDWEALLQQIKNCTKYSTTATWNWIQAHPYQTRFIVLSILTTIFTPVIIPPVLAAAGFSAVGPAAGTIAAAVQLVISPAVASSTFAILQSAAMGGYGVPILVGFVWAVATVGLVTIVLWNYFFGDKNGDVDDKDKDA